MKRYAFSVRSSHIQKNKRYFLHKKVKFHTWIKKKFNKNYTIPRHIYLNLLNSNRPGSTLFPYQHIFNNSLNTTLKG